jgi:hypothetical protein
MPQPSGGPVDSRVPGEVGVRVTGVSVLQPAPDAPAASARPSWRISKLLRQVARFVHDLLSEVP